MQHWRMLPYGFSTFNQDLLPQGESVRARVTVSRAAGRRFCGSSRREAFTLIEVLVVVAIIALLVAILLPALVRAREMARMAKCLSNTKALPQAVHSFATEHMGHAQLIGEPVEWKVLDPSYEKYDYQSGVKFGPINKASEPWLKPWPVAYAKHFGLPSMKRLEQYCEPSTSANVMDASYHFQKFGRQEAYLCPSDEAPVHNAWSPFDPAAQPFCALSYSANEDVFGSSGASPGGSNFTDGEGQPWKDGTARQETPPRARRLEGRMDRVIRPSEVIVFCDGGNEDAPKEPALLITNDGGMRMNGPYLENYERVWGRLPHFRHSRDGGVAASFADGSAGYLKPLQWVTIRGKKYVKRYTPRARVSPHEVGELPKEQP